MVYHHLNLAQTVLIPIVGIEPLIYQVLSIGFDTPYLLSWRASDRARPILSGTCPSSRPHVLVGIRRETRRDRQILFTCDATVDLALFRSGSPTLLPVLGQLRLQRLSLIRENFFPSPTPTDYGYPTSRL